MLYPNVHLNIASGSEQSNTIKSVKVNGSSKNKINFTGGKVDIRNNKHSSDSSHYRKIRSRKADSGKTENEETDLNLVDQEETRNEVRNLENTCSVNQPFMMQGSFHQGDDRFRNNSGKQCVANSLTAIAYSKLSLIDNWNMTFLDEILIEGNILYTWIHGDNEELLVTELPKMVEIRDMIVKCNRKESILALIDNNGKIEFNVLSLDHALQEALIDSDGCFVCVRGFTSAIIRQNGKMYLFDSHARNCFGLQDSCGKSVVIQINDVNSLYQHFYNFVQGDVNAEFEVTGINIEIQDEDSATNNLDKFIGNINNREVLEDENNSDVEFIGVPTQTCYLFNPIDYYTKKKLCNILDIKSKFVLKTPLMPTHSIGTPLKSKQITADGNCLFRAISYAVSNRQENFKQIRNELVRHILRHSHQFNSFLDSETVNEYMKRTNMIEDNVWGTELEIIAAADLLKTDIFTYLEGKWIKYSSKQICSKNNVNDQAIYLNNVGNHYEVVLSVLPGGKEAVTLNSKESAKKRNQSGAEKDQMNLHYELSHEGTMKRKYEQHELNFPKKCLKEDENSFGLIKKKTCLEWPVKNLAVCKPLAPNQGFTKNEKDKLKYQLDGQLRFNKIEKQNRSMNKTDHTGNQRKEKKYADDDDFKRIVKQASIQKYADDDDFKRKVKQASIQKYADDDDFKRKVKRASIQKYADDDDFKTEVKRASIQKYADDDDFKSKVKDQILTRRKNAKEESNDVTKVIENFRKNVSKGPEFVCSCCFRLLFENQVVQCKRELYKPGCGKDIADICISEKYLHRCSEECKDECLYQGASRATLWICYTCHRKILKGKIPAESFANNLALEDIPLELNRLNQLEQHLISLNIPFMKIVALPKGGQKAVHGPCVCVPSDISKVTTTLPRSEDDNCLVKVKLKRKLQYKGYEEYQFVDTKHLEEALSFLKEKNDWYSNVEINGEWLNPIPSSENICVAEKKDNKSYTRTDRFIDKYISCKLPLESDDPELTDIVKTVQQHSKNHSKSCRKKGTECRFNFPRPPSEKTFISRPIEDEEDKEHDEDADDSKKSDSESSKPSEKTFIPCPMKHDDHHHHDKHTDGDINEKSESKGSILKAKQMLACLWDVIKECEDKNLTTSELFLKAGLSQEDFQECFRWITNRNTVVLKRNKDELFINQYNPHLLKSWNANMDIQYILDAYSCVVYIISYISKSERELGLLLQQTKTEAADGNLDAQRTMKKVGTAYFHFRELSTQEAVFRVIGLRLKECSRKVQFIPLGENPCRMSIPLKELQQKSKTLKMKKSIDDGSDDDDGDSDDIWLKSITDSDDVHLPNYKLHHLPRSAAFASNNPLYASLQEMSHGGVGVYVKSDSEYEEFDTSQKNLECIIFKVPKMNVLIATIYRTQKYQIELFLRNVGALLSELTQLSSSIIVLGDFNQDIMKGGRSIQDFMASFGFEQLVQEATTEGGTLIDHVYIKSCVKVQVSVIPTYYSYHDAISVILEINPTS
ncbi:unnamed protein product [Mytilus edulis]|uniref:OTU domain-containing protein n=1 Tax=Mytilus edulis TaxID=6550 RepID=A0A8S3QWB4_MYTED|nr:unnamed protein product [Mytilus edulis]